MSGDHWLELSLWQARGGASVHEDKRVPGLWHCDLLELDAAGELSFCVKAIGESADAAVIAALSQAA